MRPVAALRLFAHEAVVPPAYLPCAPFRRFACSYLESHYPRRQTALKPLITVELLPAMLQSAPRRIYRATPNPGSRVLPVYFSAALLLYITQSDDSAISCIFCSPMQHPLAGDALKNKAKATLVCIQTDAPPKIATVWRC